MRTQIPGSQVKDESIDTVDINDSAVTDIKLSSTGISAGDYTKLTINTKGRATAGSNPSTLAGLGVSAALEDLTDVLLTTPANKDILAFDGTNWINQSVDEQKSLKLYSENPQAQVNANALGFNSVAIGSGAEAGSSNSVAIGDQSLSRVDGSIYHANGRFGSQGDAQTASHLLRSHSVNASPTELFLNGTAGGERLTITDDTTWVWEATIVGHQQDGDGHAGFKLKGVLYKVGAVNTSMLGAVTKDVISAHPGWDVAAVADGQNGALKITVTGEAGKIIRWFAHISTVEVTN